MSRGSARFLAILLLLVAVVVVVDATIVSTADSRLPMSLSTIVSDLEAEGCTELSTACWITSRSVSREKRVALLQAILDSGDISIHNAEAGTADTWKAVAVANGFCLAQPADDASETASAVAACGGIVLYYADPTDLARGEGLFDRLAPAMEKILATTTTNGSSSKATLYVITEGDEAATTTVKDRLEQAAAPVLANIITGGDDGNAAPVVVTRLQDVFQDVVYVSPNSAMAAVLSHDKTTPSDVAARVAELWSASDSPSLFELTTTTTASSQQQLSPANLAAARRLGPAARIQYADILGQVEVACEKQGGLVPQFGQLCDAALKQAASLGDSGPLSSCAVGKQIVKNLRADLDASLSDLFQEQLDLLQLQQFEQFKGALSKLFVSPNLENDMRAAAQKSVASYRQAAKKLVPKSAQSAAWNVAPATAEYARKCHDHVTKRILNAQASGKFKPLPRKGVTVGLHWLLPKPFGNDFRQEPWMVHATDGMVYIPKDGKVADVSPEEVAAGDWRDKIVPSPAGNDMLYMQ